jgi:membrane peptidoglycan carboxypeptidase
MFLPMARIVPVLLCLCLLATGCGSFVRVEVQVGDVQPVEAPQQTLVYASDGSRIATLRFANRTLVDYDQLPQLLIDAVVAAEDRRFFDHDGVDLRAIVRAALANRRAGRIVQGGSTITQQLIKNRYFPKAEDTLERKATEAQLARELERAASKDEILIDYLNTVYLGTGAYGIQAAAQTYFGTDVAALDTTQAALLVGLMRAPESASPYQHPDRARAERRRVLDAMVAEGYLSRADAAAAARAPLGVIGPPAPPATRFPYFVEHVKRVLLRDPAFGPDEEARVRWLFGGGLRVYTTIDPALQEKAEAAAQSFWSGPDDPEVAIAVVEPGTGRLVAAVGGRDFASNQFDLATQARRQPGSVFKTFALVAALRDGMRPDDRIDSGSARLAIGDDFWSVRSATSGLITLRDALVHSSNGAFARLALRVGGARIAEQARLMGVSAPLNTDPAVALGGLTHGVSPLDMASAYATLANGGVHIPPTVVTRVTDANGALVWQPPAERRVAVTAEVAWQTTQGLRAAIEEGTGRLARLDRPAAGKTGTVQQYRDAWFVGYTPQLSAAVWVGYPDAPRPLLNVHGVARVEGGTWPARIWRVFMEAAHEGQPVLEFDYPEHLEITVLVDPTTELLATPWCPLTEERRGLASDLPVQYCPVHGPPLPPEPSDDGGPASETPEAEQDDEVDGDLDAPSDEPAPDDGGAPGLPSTEPPPPQSPQDADAEHAPEGDGPQETEGDGSEETEADGQAATEGDG